MAWKGPHLAPQTVTQQRARKRNREQASIDRKEDLKARGLCYRCGKKNDLAGTKTKNGREAGTCTGCRRQAKVERERERSKSQASIADMERALGMPVLGVGGRGVK